MPVRASSKGCTIRRVEIPSNKLLTTAFEASLECIIGKRWITPRIPYLPKPCHNYCMEWQVFCFSVLHLGPFYFKSFGACAISTLNNIRSKRHLWQKENIVQMRSGFLWFRSAAWLDLRISNGARRIKSVRVTFITWIKKVPVPGKKI